MHLSKKILISFIIIVLVSIGLVSLIANISINKKFDFYLVEEKESKLNSISQSIEVICGHSIIDTNKLDNLAEYENISFSIYDESLNLIYSSNSSGHMMKIHGNSNGMMRRMHGNSSSDKEYTYIMKNGYSLKLQYQDDNYLSESAYIFKGTLTKSILIAGSIALVFGIIFSLYTSKTITNPLVEISNISNKILKNEKIPHLSSDIIEIQDIYKSLEYLSLNIENQEKLRQEYSSNISHELRTPLTTIKSYLEAIDDGIWQLDSHNMKILREEIDRINQLIDDLSRSFYMEEGNLVIQKDYLNIKEEVLDGIQIIRPKYDKKGFIIESNLEDIRAYIDKDKFKQVLLNLLSNSYNYMEENSGIVTIRLKESNNDFILSLKDNGMGIPSSSLDRVFDRLYRVDSSRNKSTGGSGLGLSIVKDIVEAHKGNISVNSLYGHYTEFIIVIPKE